MDSDELLAQDRKNPGRSLSYKRRCLQSMIVGQTSVFYPDRGDTGGESLQLVNYHVIFGCVGDHRSKPETITEEAI